MNIFLTFFKILIVAFLYAFLLACSDHSIQGSEKPITENQEPDIKPTMNEASSTSNVSVKGTVYSEKSCGNIPTVDKESCQGRSASSMTFTIIAKSTKQRYQLESDTSGAVTAILPPDIYHIESPPFLMVNPEQFTVSDKHTEFEWTFKAKLR